MGCSSAPVLSRFLLYLSPVCPRGDVYIPAWLKHPNLTKMKTRYYILIALSAYLLYTPVPDGLAHPWKYRALMASTRFLRLIAKAENLIWPDAPNDVTVFRNAFKLVTARQALEEPGSNFRARVTQFDGVKVRLYEPIKKSKSLLPGFVYFHGGGFAFGSTELYDRLTRKIADDLNAVVVSVENITSTDG